jgi:hypothetical protein
MSPEKTAARDIVLSLLLYGATLVLTGEFDFARDSPATAFTIVWGCHVAMTLWSLHEERRQSSLRLTLVAGDVGQPTLQHSSELEKAPRP